MSTAPQGARARAAAARPTRCRARPGSNQVLREIVAEELERIDDERLEHVHVTTVDVDSDLNRAIVYYDSLAGEAGDAEVLEAFAARRVRLQAAVGRQLHARKTPVLEFRPDDVLRSAERIDQILRDLAAEERRTIARRKPPTVARPGRRRQAGRLDEPRRGGQGQGAAGRAAGRPRRHARPRRHRRAAPRRRRR